MKVKRKEIKKEKGVILVMAMMILALMMSSVLALARIIMGEISMTRNIDNSIIAFYAAESGIEKGLYYVKKSGEDYDFFDFTNLTSQSYSFYEDPERGIKITEASIEADDWSAYNISEEEVVHVNIIDPSGDVVPDFIHNKNSYKVEWEIEDCSAHTDERLEITLEYFEHYFTNPGTQKHLITCSSCDLINENLCSGDGSFSFESIINENRYYFFSFNPLEKEGGGNNYISNLSFTALLDTGDEGILSEISIKAEGDYRNSKQYLQARLPALGSVSDIFSYVIFSGEDLAKTTN